MIGRDKNMKPEKIAALVPMRHHSQRVVGKNYRPLAGKPLYYHILESLQTCPEIQTIVVDTDSPVIKEGIEKDFPQIIILDRPPHLQADTIPMNEILLYDTSHVAADLYLQTHSTNPLLKPETISAAIHTLLEVYPAYDSLFSVTKIQTRLYDQLGRPINHNPAVLLRTQDLPPIYEENSCLYLFNRSTLEFRRNRLGERPFMFPISPDEAWDIDDELNFLVADLLMKYRRKQI